MIFYILPTKRFFDRFIMFIWYIYIYIGFQTPYEEVIGPQRNNQTTFSAGIWKTTGYIRAWISYLFHSWSIPPSLPKSSRHSFWFGYVPTHIQRCVLPLGLLSVFFVTFLWEPPKKTNGKMKVWSFKPSNIWVISFAKNPRKWRLWP